MRVFIKSINALCDNQVVLLHDIFPDIPADCTNSTNSRIIKEVKSKLSTKKLNHDNDSNSNSNGKPMIRKQHVSLNDNTSEVHLRIHMLNTTTTNTTTPTQY